MPGESQGIDADYMASYFKEMLRFMMPGSQEGASARDPSEGGQSEPQRETPDFREAVEFMARAYPIFMDSGPRFWGRWAEINMNYYAAISQNLSAMNSDPNSRDEAMGTMTDMLRAYFREMAELPEQEFRRMQANFESGTQTTSSSAASESAGPYRRGHRVKD